MVRHRPFFAVVALVTLATLAPAEASAQLCPASLEGMPLERPANFTGKVNEVSCKPGLYGSEECETMCFYRLPRPAIVGIPHVRIFAEWYTRPYTKAAPFWSYHSDSCKVLDSPGRVNSSQKVVVVQFDRVDNPGSDSYAIGKRAAERLVGVIEGVALSCPGAASAPPPTPVATSCERDAARLQTQLLKAAEIDSELRQLEQWVAANQLEADRERLSYYNRMIAALNTQGYNGALREEILKIRADAPYREELLRQAQLPPGAPPIDAFRAFRDAIAFRIDYLRNAPARRTVLLDERVLTELWIAEARTALAQGNCGGRTAADSCDIRGQWSITTTSSSPDTSALTEFWTFTPAAGGRYEALVNSRTEAVAELYGRDLILRWRNPSLSGTTTATLADTCAFGRGEARFTGATDSHQVTMSRIGAPQVFVEGRPYAISFEGRTFNTTYRREQANGVPIDVFFFPILDRFGQQVAVDGNRIWGRFVRVPATTHVDQARAEWWFVDHQWNGSAWVMAERRGVAPVVR